MRQSHTAVTRFSPLSTGGKIINWLMPLQSLELKRLQKLPAARPVLSNRRSRSISVVALCVAPRAVCQRQRHVGIYISVPRSTFCPCWVILLARMRSRFCFESLSFSTRAQNRRGKIMDVYDTSVSFAPCGSFALIWKEM